jgi:hypothetical protein
MRSEEKCPVRGCGKPKLPEKDLCESCQKKWIQAVDYLMGRQGAKP